MRSLLRQDKKKKTVGKTMATTSTTRRHASKTEATMSMAIPTLPQEIIAEILSRLPVKSLGQFRCVSKPWLSLISDTHFIKMHLKQRLSQKVFMSFWFRLKIRSLDFEALVNHVGDEKSAIKNLQLPLELGSIRRVKILGSCDGLLCLRLGDNDVIIWNPCIREYKKLQEFNGLGGSYGFGYDCENDDYKLVKVIPRNGSDEISVDVFSLKTNSWRRVCYGGYKFDLVDDVGTLLNGAVYWQANRGDTKDTSFIVSFDIVNEKFSELPIPDCKFVEGPMLGVLGGSLCACRSEFGKDVEMWAMKEDGAKVSWIKFATVRLGMEPEYIREYSIPLCFAKNGEALMLKGGLQLDAYNLKKNGYRRLFISPDGDCEFDGALYVESLVSPNVYDGAHWQTPSIQENDQEKIDGVARLERFDLG